jgi:hypothetical protein
MSLGWQPLREHFIHYYNRIAHPLPGGTLRLVAYLFG